MKLKVAEVRDIDDPTYSGCCRIRTYNETNDENNVKDKDLPWATPLHPVTSAATAGVGVLPQLIPGSRVLICYLDNDTFEQYPIILGSLGRGELPSQEGVRKKSDEDSGGKTNTAVAGPDSPLSHPDYKYTA
jgi:hypothetical protein